MNLVVLANKNEFARFWDPVRFIGFWHGSCCLILLSPMHQNRSRYRFGAQVTREKNRWNEMHMQSRKDKRSRTGKGL